jgi:hypothetical protein
LRSSNQPRPFSVTFNIRPWSRRFLAAALIDTDDVFNAIRAVSGRIFPVSAQKGLVARIQGDRDLLRRSRLADLETALTRASVDNGLSRDEMRGTITLDSSGPLGVMLSLVLGPSLVLTAIPLIRERATQGLADSIAEDMLPMITVVLEEGAAGRQAPADLSALAPELAADPDADWHRARGRQGPLAYRYLRPARIEALEHAVPVLIDDPALHRGLIVVAMGDGRIIVVRGEAAARIWAAAGRKPAGASWTANEARALLDGIQLPP